MGPICYPDVRCRARAYLDAPAPSPPWPGAIGHPPRRCGCCSMRFTPLLEEDFEAAFQVDFRLPLRCGISVEIGFPASGGMPIFSAAHPLCSGIFRIIRIFLSPRRPFSGCDSGNAPGEQCGGVSVARLRVCRWFWPAVVDACRMLRVPCDFWVNCTLPQNGCNQTKSAGVTRLRKPM